MEGDDGGKLETNLIRSMVDELMEGGKLELKLIDKKLASFRARCIGRN